jgi:hypothetical protein
MHEIYQAYRKKCGAEKQRMPVSGLIKREPPDAENRERNHYAKEFDYIMEFKVWRGIQFGIKLRLE